MVIIRLMRMIVFTIVVFKSLSFDIHAAARDQWRVRADAYVASLNPIESVPVKKIMALLHDARTHADIALCTQYIGRLSRDADVHCHTLSVKAVGALYEYFKQTLLHMVHDIDAQIAFLEYRQTNPMSMLLYRSPLTWRTTKNNMELHNESNALHTRKEQYLRILGNSIFAVESFPRPASVHEAAAWLSCVTEAILKRPVGSLASRDQLVAVLNQALEGIENERKMVDTLTADATTSNRIETGINYVQRAGVFGMIALISGSGFLMGRIMTEDAEEVLEKHRTEMSKTMKEAAKQFDKKLKEDKKPKDETPREKDTAQPGEPIRPESSASSTDSKSDKTPPTSSREDDKNDATETELGDPTKNSPKNIFAKMGKAVRNLAGSTSQGDKAKEREEAAPELRPPSPKLSIGEQLVASTGKNVVEGALKNPEISAGLKNFNKVLEMIQEKLSGVTGTVIYEGINNVGAAAGSILDNKLKSKAGLAISGSSIMAGLAAMAWYIKRIASKNGKVYTAMKQGMLDIEDILSCYDQPNQIITAYHLGHLAYIGSQLNEYASAVLSHAESQLLASDVAQLQSPSISIANKSKRVQRMYSTYSFLVPSRAMII